MMLKNPLIIASMCLALVMVNAAEAESLTRMLRKSGLTPQDLELMTAAETSLYVNTTIREGAEASWSNPDTTASGRVRLYDHRGNCANIAHQFTARNKNTRSIQFRVCQQSDGRWLFAAD